MHSDDYLDAPPPSQFRRPWSPDPSEPLPAIHNVPDHAINTHDDYWDPPPAEHPQQPRWRREPSDPSVEALDLADYARTLRAQRRTTDRYPPFHSQESHSPRSPPPRLSSPSLASHGRTSTQSHPHSSASRASHRPFSLPPPVRPIPYPDLSLNTPRVGQSVALSRTEPEIDISQFPRWSRNWYDNTKASPYPPFPKAHLDNPSYSSISHDYPTYGNALSSHDHATPAYSSHPSSRDLLPWVIEPPDHRPPIDPETKEERIRMLQREFGSRPKTNDDTDGYHAIGSVDAKGKLITEGPKKRVGFRVLQLVLALGAAIPSIYAAVVIKAKGSPPPAATPPAFLLYVLSVITTFALFYLVIIYPCCGGRSKPLDPNDGPLAGGLMVLPVQSLPGGKKQKGGKKGQKKGMPGGPTGDLQVNLIVDPNAFAGRGRRDEDGDDDTINDYGEGSMPGGYGSERQSKPRRQAQRRGFFQGLAMEAQWKSARSALRKTFLFDLLGVAVWGAEFLFILFGKRCPSGGYDGWCNAYNVSSAAACLLCIAFGFSTFFDVKDLFASKVSPRTRT